MNQYFRLVFIYCFIAVTKLQAQGWVKVNSTFDPPENYNTYYGVFVDAMNGWWVAGPNASVLHTTNGGGAWKKQVDSIALENIEFIDTLHGWMVGRILPHNIYNILITKDGGKSWSRYITPVITRMTFFDSLNGFAGGDSIYATTDGGVTWKTREVEPNSAGFGITDIFFIDRKNGWAVGGSGIADGGVILNTVDSGKTWKYNNPLTTIGEAVYFTDSLHGYIAGSPTLVGMIKVTSDGGANWITRYLPCSSLRDIAFTDDSTGWIVGDYGFIWHTTDRGVNWTRVESGTTSGLNHIYFFENGNVGYIFGGNNTLLKYDKTVSVKEEKTFTATSFSLLQNYPNPFNPTTTLSYQLPITSYINLKVYDILGKEIATLVNGQKEKGVYITHFTPKNLSSSIYFVRMVAGDFIQTNKIIYVK